MTESYRDRIRGLSTLFQDIEPVKEEVTRTVADASDQQTNLGIIRTDPDALGALGVRAGGSVGVGQTCGGNGIPTKVWRSDADGWEKRRVYIPRPMQREAGVQPGDDVVLKPINPAPARVVSFNPPADIPRQVSDQELSRLLQAELINRPVIQGTVTPIKTTQGVITPYVFATVQSGPVRIVQDTDIRLMD